MCAGVTNYSSLSWWERTEKHLELTSCWSCWWAPWWSTLVSSPQVLLSLELELWHPALSPVYAAQCYNCGYRILNGGEPEALPEGDLKYCSDFANPNDIVTDCSQPSDCCASMKELIVRYPPSQYPHESLMTWWHVMFRVNETSGTNSTELIAKHSCGSDLGEVEGRHHYCSEHPNSCFNVDDATFPNHDNISTITDIEVCFCSNDRLGNLQDISSKN